MDQIFFARIHVAAQTDTHTEVPAIGNKHRGSLIESKYTFRSGLYKLHNIYLCTRS